MSALFNGMAWVSSTGEYSLGSDLIVFDPERLDTRQRETIQNLGDSDRLTYVLAIVNQNIDLMEYMERVANAY